MDGVDFDKILRSNKVSSVEKGYKYFIGYNDYHYRIKSSCIMLPKISRHAKSFSEAKCMPFLFNMTDC